MHSLNFTLSFRTQLTIKVMIVFWVIDVGAAAQVELKKGKLNTLCQVGKESKYFSLLSGVKTFRQLRSFMTVWCHILAVASTIHTYLLFAAWISSGLFVEPEADQRTTDSFDGSKSRSYRRSEVEPEPRGTRGFLSFQKQSTSHIYHKTRSRPPSLTNGLSNASGAAGFFIVKGIGGRKDEVLLGDAEPPEARV